MATTRKKTRNNTTTSDINSSSSSSNSNNQKKKLYVYNLNNNGLGSCRSTPDQYYPISITNSVMSTTAKKILSRSYWGITKRSSKLPNNNNNIIDYNTSSKSKSNTNCNIIKEYSEFEKKELASEEEEEEEGKKGRRHHPASNSAATYHHEYDDTTRRSVSEVESYLISAGSRSKKLSFNYSTTTPTTCSSNNNNNNNNIINKDVVISSIVEGGRKSVSHVDNNVAFVGMKMITSTMGRTSFKLADQEAANLLQVKVMVADMPAFMQLQAFRCARTTFDSLETFSAKHIAFTLKKEFDKIYGPAWHCIVGSSFGSFVTHSTGCFLYFSLDTNLYVLLFRTKVRKTLD